MLKKHYYKAHDEFKQSLSALEPNWLKSKPTEIQQVQTVVRQASVIEEPVPKPISLKLKAIKGLQRYGFKWL